MNNDDVETILYAGFVLLQNLVKDTEKDYRKGSTYRAPIKLRKT